VLDACANTWDGKEVMLPRFLSDNTITVLIKFKHFTFIILQTEGIFSPMSSFYQCNFSTFACDALCRTHLTLCWSFGALQARCVSARPSPQNCILGVYISVGQKDGSRRELKQECSGMREIFHPTVTIVSLVRRLLWGLRLPCRMRTWSIVLFGRTLRIRCFNFFNVFQISL